MSRRSFPRKRVKQAVCLLIRNAEGKFLLHMRDNSPGIYAPLTWSFFGGGVDEGEEVVQAAKRELLEELGIDADMQDFIPMGSFEHREIDEHLVSFTPTVDWGQFKVFEGAGAGFFLREDFEKITTSSILKAHAEKFLPLTQ